MEIVNTAILLLEQYRVLATVAAAAALLYAVVSMLAARRAYRRATADAQRERSALVQALAVLESTLTLYAEYNLYVADANGDPGIFTDCGSRARSTLEAVEAMLEAL